MAHPHLLNEKTNVSVNQPPFETIHKLDTYTAEVQDV
jgi:hypothetical protein